VARGITVAAMELAQLVCTAWPVSMFLIALSLSSRTSLSRVTSLLRAPALLLRSKFVIGIRKS